MGSTLELNIRALVISVGYVEEHKVSEFTVEWTGERAFRNAADAIRDFLAQCDAARTQVKKLLPCCEATLGHNPKAKACEACGSRTSRTPKSIDLYQYLYNIHDSNQDCFSEAAHPFDMESEAAYDRMLGKWRFFSGIPENCDVVFVMMDDNHAKKFNFRTMRVGVWNAGPNAEGTFRNDR